jgi:hypothetical protein
MTRNWYDLEGVSLDERYWLKHCLSSTPDDAWYLIRFDTTRDAVVRVLPADSPGADEQLATWRAAMAFEHPHIVRMLDAGRAETEAGAVIYAVCESPDDFLAVAVAERRLSDAEALAVLDALVSGLAYLHEQSFTHGAVDPAHIMAFGDTIKLPSDTIYRGDRATDMQSLGATLQEIVEQPPAEPFATIIERTVTGRWTIHDVENFLAPPESLPEPAVVAEETAPAPAPVSAPVLVQRPLPARANRGFPIKWAPTAGLVAAIGLGAIFMRHPDEPVAAIAPAPIVTPAPAASAAPPRVATAPVEHSNPSAIWRVVVYTYASRAAAEKKARSLNEKRAAWRAEVFAPKGDRAPYYVSLGGRMTLPQAERLQREARTKGLPRDTFVRNFRS